MIVMARSIALRASDQPTTDAAAVCPNASVAAIDKHEDGIRICMGALTPMRM
jgi:hypothetical protein